MTEEPHMRQDIPGNYNAVAQGSGNPTVNVNNVYAPPIKKWLQGTRWSLSRAFVGRQNLRDTLAQELTAGAGVIISGRPIAQTLQGMGGIGKTYLALQLAIELYESFPGGILRIDIGPEVRDEVGTQRPLRKLASYAFDGIPPLGQLEPEQVASWLDEIAPGRFLVILDDVWHPEPLRLLSRALPSKAIRLVTTRFAAIAREVGGKVVSLEHLSPEDGLALLEDRLDCRGESSYRAGLEALVALLGGHALALDIVAARIQKPMRLQAVLHELQHGIGRGVLDGLKLLSGEERDENVEKTLALSYEQMQPEQRQRFRELGAFAIEAPITAEAAAALWSMDDVVTAQNALFELSDMALLTEVEETIGHTTFYRQHSLLHCYAHALLDKAGEVADVCLRHAQYYAERSWHIVTTTRDYTLLDQDLQNLLAALQWTDTNEPPLLARLLDALDHFLLLRGQSVLLETYLPKAIIATSTDKRRQANLLRTLGDLERHLGNIDQARSHYDAALPLYGLERDRLGEANVYMSMGDMFLAQENWREARKYYEQALPLYIVERDPLGQANTLIDLGRVRFELGEQLQGMRDEEQAATLFRFVQAPQWADRAEQYLAEMQRKLKGKE